MHPLRALSIFLITSAAVSPARATITQVIGGPGGGPFTMQCPDGQAAVGVHAKAGTWVDGVGLLCKRTIGNMEPVGWAGGSGGGPQEVYCAAGQYVSGIFLTFTRGNDLPRQYVNTIGILCGTAEAPRTSAACILSGDTIDDDYVKRTCSFREGSGGFIEADELACPADEVVIGLHGRNGSYIDAMGAICGARPQAAFLPVIIGPSAPEKAGDVRMTPGDVGTALPIGHAAGIPAPAVDNPATQIPPDPIKPAVVTPILIPSVITHIDRCKTGYVWRESTADDHVCVTPESRDRVRMENSVAASRVNPQGAYGPNTCVSGFVWREAFSGDLVCVTPEVRALVREENAQATVRKL